MAASISTLKAMLVLDTSQWNQGFLSAQKTASGFGSGLLARATGYVKGFAGAMVGAGAAGITAGVGFSEVLGSLQRVGSLSSTAKKLGLNVEQVQRLGIAAEQSGVDLDTLSKFMFIMGKNIGSGGMSMDKRFLQVSDAISQIKDPAEKAAVAFKVFGKGGYELIGLLSKGSEGIKRSADAVERFGLAISDIKASQAKEALLTFKELKTVIGGLKDKLLIEAAPAFTTFFQTWLNGIEVLVRDMENLKKFSEQPPKREGWFWSLPAYLSKDSPTIGEVFKGMDEMRKDAERDRINAAKGAKMAGNGIAGRGLNGIAAGGRSHGGALQFGSVEAMSAITKAGGGIGSSIAPAGLERFKPEIPGFIARVEKAIKAEPAGSKDAPAWKAMLDELRKMNRNDRRQALRPSNMRGGGGRP